MTKQAKPKDPTVEELYECLAEGQARVMDYLHSMLNIEHEAQLHGEPGRKAAVEKSQKALQKVMEWAMHRDDVDRKPHPLEAAWAFRQRAFDTEREKVIQTLEETLQSLKAHRPSSFQGPPTARTSGAKFKSPKA